MPTSTWIRDEEKYKMAARGPHIQKFVILAATLCCDNLTISWPDKHTLDSFMKSSFQAGKFNHPWELFYQMKQI